MPKTKACNTEEAETSAATGAVATNFKSFDVVMPPCIWTWCQFDELIRTGKIPRPMSLSEGGRATGYTGSRSWITTNTKQLAAKKQAPGRIMTD